MTGLAAPTVEAIEAWGSDPALFFEQALGLRVWSRQREILNLVRDAKRGLRKKRISTRSGHKVSKSTTFAGLAWWFPLFVDNCRVLLTSSSGPQVQHILWRDLGIMRRRAADRGIPLGGHWHDLASSGVQFKNGNDILGRSTDEPENIAGWSGANLVVLADEASGIPDPIFEAIHGNMAGGGWLFMFGNPTQNDGQFYRSHHGESDLWETVHISSEESPNVTGREPPVPGLATPEWVEEYRTKCAPDPDQHAEYKVRVKGEFAGQGLNNPVTLDRLVAAEKRWADTPAEGPLEVGLDVAREGDDTSVAAPRRGKKVLPLEPLPPGDGKVVADHCVARVAKHKPPGQDKIRVNVDAIGVGASAFDHLKRRKDVDAFAVNVSLAADDTEHHHNLRSQVYFAVGDFCAEGGALPPDPAMRAEFLAHTFFFDAQGRYQLIKKEDVKKKIKRSPDRSEAVTLAVYRPRRTSGGLISVNIAPRL
ncbi:MAG TPA: hypothetical protein VFS43_40890 [Polyangiaceae bacterium]|nr:hypothetical protein [Polyangiaceae bacterium]